MIRPTTTWRRKRGAGQRNEGRVRIYSSDETASQGFSKAPNFPWQTNAAAQSRPVTPHHAVQCRIELDPPSPRPDPCSPQDEERESLCYQISAPCHRRVPSSKVAALHPISDANPPKPPSHHQQKRKTTCLPNQGWPKIMQSKPHRPIGCLWVFSGILPTVQGGARFGTMQGKLKMDAGGFAENAFERELREPRLYI